MIVWYRSAIAAIHQGFPNGSRQSLNTDIATLLNGIYIVTVRPRTLRELWDLLTILFVFVLEAVAIWPWEVRFLRNAVSVSVIQEVNVYM